MPSSDASRNVGLKRKVSSKLLSTSRKKLKLQQRSADDLPWKAVRIPIEAGLIGDEGILELEEVEGVDVVYDTTEGGRVAKFNVVQGRSPETEEGVEDELGEDEAEDTEPPETEPIVVEDLPEFDSENLLPEWQKFPLDTKVKMALHARGFSTPTAIQAASLPVTLASRDVVGVAQTGSGKTLAYGLPILHYLLSQPRPSSSKKRPLCALVLAPTRELALQVSSHLNAISHSIETLTNPKVLNADNAEDTPEAGSSNPPAKLVKRPPPHVSVAAIVGGMSSQKQKRVLDRGVDILIATPGRLWDLLQDDDELAQEMRKLRFLVLDEADRMIEAGHFAELENILRLTLKESQDEEIPNDADLKTDGQQEDEEDTKVGVKDDLQTFVFSATLSKDLQRNLKKKFRPKGNKKHYKHDQVPASTLDDLLLRLDFRDPNPEVIDLSPVGGVVSTLQEGKIECLSGDKDVYLYYFLLRYPGKSLVFLSSIDGIRRLMPLVELLNIKAYPLHSQLEQRQRLKNLDRFTKTPNSVLLATDIAARGLDISAVDHVIHFQIPRSADTYIHRNGRTARAMRKGFSMLMVAPDERRVVKALLGSLGRDEAEIPEMSIELGMLDKLKNRVQLARKIETAQHKVKKSKHDRNWMKETAEALGVELDSDFISDAESEDRPSNKKRKAQDREMATMKAELGHLLSQPLLARGISTKYITSGSRPIVDDILAGEFNETMLGLKKAEAGSEMAAVRQKKKSKAPKSAVKKEEM